MQVEVILQLFVIDRLLRFYKSRKVQPHGYYPVSELAGTEMDEASHACQR